MDPKRPSISKIVILKDANSTTPEYLPPVIRLVRDPLRRCALVVLCGFFFFLAEGLAAVLVHNEDILIASLALHGTLLFVLVSYVGITLFMHRRKHLQYNANLVNTTSTCILTIVLCMILYPLLWHPGLNREVLHEEVQDMKAMPPPALAWITINDRHDAAHLLDYPHPKGFMTDIAGGFGSNMTDCSAQTPEVVLTEHYCNCTEMFTEVETAPLANHAGGMSFRTFRGDPKIMFGSTNTTLNLQIYSDHNTSATPRDWMLPGPMLLLMAYDPRLSMMDAFLGGVASITHIPVLASTNLVLSPQYRVGWNRDPYYYYRMHATSVPSLNDICDVGNDYVTWCYTTTVVQFADMTRTVSSRVKAMSPGDVFAQVGGYFALIQLLCWVISGMAFR